MTQLPPSDPDGIPQFLLRRNWVDIPPTLMSTPKISVKVEPEPEIVAELLPDHYIRIQNGIRESASLTIAEINGLIDDWVEDKTPDYESVYDILVKMETKQPQAKLALIHFEPLWAEAQELKVRDCPQLNEAYRFLNQKINKYVELVQSIIDDLERYINNKKQTVVRKPRKKKAKSAEKLVAGIKYLPSYPELKIVSVPPQQIIGAESVWLYNVKQRVLTQLIARTRDGLTVKGKSIIDYDVDNSIKKKVRKPDQILPKVLDGGKVVLRKLMSSIKAAPQEISGRLNNETIILKVLK